MATIDELHAQSVSGDIGGLKRALINALRTGAEFVSPPANGPGAAVVSGIRSLLPGRGDFSQEFDRYNRAAAPSPLYSGPERFGSVVKEPGAPGMSQGESEQAKAMAMQTALIAALRLTEKRRDILFDRKGPANEPIRDLEHWEKGPMEYWRPKETEMVPVEELKKIREFDRAGAGANPGSLDTISALGGNISAYGLENPLMISYWAPDKRAIIGEGNHRLEAAIRQGMEELPARVYGSGYPVGSRDTVGCRRPPVLVRGTVGRGTGELSPSAIGLKARPLTPEEAALNGKKLRIGYPERYRTSAQKREWADREFTDIAGEMRDAEWARRNPPEPLDPGTQKILDLLGWGNR